MKKMFGEVAVFDGEIGKRFVRMIEKAGGDLEVKAPQDDLKRFIPMEVPPTERQLTRRPPKVGRNEPCPCGSGKKFKKCCLNSKEGR